MSDDALEFCLYMAPPDTVYIYFIPISVGLARGRLEYMSNYRYTQC